MKVQKSIIFYVIIFMISCRASKDIQTIDCKTDFYNQKNINYIYSEQESFQSKILKFGMSVLRMKDRLEKAIINGSGKLEAEEPSDSLKKDFIFTITEHKERIYWKISPKEKTNEKVIFYLHGGAYINNIVKFQWNMIEEIARKTNTTIVVPDYPLAPQNNYEKTYSFIESIYSDLLIQTKPENIIFLGDSAGGGLSLGFAQKLQKEKKPNPSQIILIAPWLDVTMSDLEIQNIDPLDKLLNVKGLIWAGEMYAEKLSTKDPLISPIYGDIKNLGKISIFIGTHDILFADSIRLKKNLESNQISFNYFEYPKMFHVWPVIIGMKESDIAIDQISSLILCGM